MLTRDATSWQSVLTGLEMRVDQTMQASFDFKTPSVVVAGHWNAAILNEPGWIARNILDIPDGQGATLEGITIADKMETGQIFPQKNIWLFDDYGMGCTGQRVELYVRNIKKLEAIYLFMKKLIELLPHTPIGAVGLNFKACIDNEDQNIFELVDTDETFDSFGAVGNWFRREKIDIKEKDMIKEGKSGSFSTVLNLSRNVTRESVEIDFNYHTPVDSMKTLSAYSDSCPIDHWFKHAGRVLNTVYSLNQLEETYF